MANTGWPSPPQNTGNGSAGQPVADAKPSNVGTPLPRPVASPRLRLHKVSDIQRELRRLYISCRNGEVASSEASRLAYLLNMLANLIADSDLEARVERIEKAGPRK